MNPEKGISPISDMPLGAGHREGYAKSCSRRPGWHGVSSLPIAHGILRTGHVVLAGDAKNRGCLRAWVKRSNGMAGYFGFGVTVIVTGRQGMATSVFAGWAAASFLKGT